MKLSKSISASGIVLFVFDKTLPIEELIGKEVKTLPYTLIHQGVIKAALHLINNGSSKIALLLGAHDHTICFDMLNGYKAALQESDMPFSEKLVKAPSGEY